MRSGVSFALVDWRRRSLDCPIVAGPQHPGVALGADGKTLVVAHQMLNSLARSTFDGDLHWGLCDQQSSRRVCVIQLEAVLLIRR